MENIKMDSIKTILHSKKFQKESSRQLNLLINKFQRKTSKPDVSAFSPMSPTERTERNDRQTSQTITESKKENAA